jgi:hypothetical protein
MALFAGFSLNWDNWSFAMDDLASTTKLLVISHASIKFLMISLSDQFKKPFLKIKLYKFIKLYKTIVVLASRGKTGQQIQCT